MIVNKNRTFERGVLSDAYHLYRKCFVVKHLCSLFKKSPTTTHMRWNVPSMYRKYAFKRPIKTSAISLIISAALTFNSGTGLILIMLFHLPKHISTEGPKFRKFKCFS